MTHESFALPRRALLACTVCALSSTWLSSTAWAESNWPTRPITLIIPGAAGGSTDTPARLLAQKLSERLGQPVVVDNKPGAGGSLGANLVAPAASTSALPRHLRGPVPS